MFTLRGKQVAGGRARDAGGQVIVEPMDVMDAGRMAFVAHPAGGYVGLWQPGNHKGAQLVNEPGALTWNQLHTRDQPGAGAFYGAVFGWTLDASVFNLGEGPIAGIMGMPAGTPDEVPAYWMTIFSVADCDESVAKASELGGTVVSPPTDLEGIGRFALLTDSQGVYFGIIASD